MTTSNLISNSQKAMSMSKSYVSQLGLNVQQYDALYSAKVLQATKAAAASLESKNYINVTNYAIKTVNFNIDDTNKVCIIKSNGNDHFRIFHPHC